MVKCILVGYGYWGKIVAEYIRRSECFELAGICSPHTGHMAALVQMIKSGMPECAFVCVPVGAHYETVAALLENGIHVFCEKPLCRNMADTLRLYEAAERKGVVLFVDYIYTASPSLRYIREHTDLLGRVRYVNMYIRQFGRFYKDDDVYDVIGVHMVSALVCLFSEHAAAIRVTDVHTVVRDREKKAEYGIVRFQAGEVEAKMECSLVSDRKERRIEIICENGLLIFDMMDAYTVKIIRHSGDDVQKEQEILFREKLDEMNNLKYMLDKFYQAIQGNDLKNKSISLQVAAIMAQLRRIDNDD